MELYLMVLGACVVLGFMVFGSLPLEEDSDPRGGPPYSMVMGSICMGFIMFSWVLAVLFMVGSAYAPDSWWVAEEKTQHSITLADLAYCSEDDENTPRCMLRPDTLQRFAPGKWRWVGYNWKLIEREDAEQAVVVQPKRLLCFGIPCDMKTPRQQDAGGFGRLDIAELRMPVGTYKAWQQAHPAIVEAQGACRRLLEEAKAHGPNRKADNSIGESDCLRGIKAMVR